MRGYVPRLSGYLPRFTTCGGIRRRRVPTLAPFHHVLSGGAGTNALDAIHGKLPLCAGLPREQGQGIEPVVAMAARKPVVATVVRGSGVARVPGVVAAVVCWVSGAARAPAVVMVVRGSGVARAPGVVVAAVVCWVSGAARAPAVVMVVRGAACIGLPGFAVVRGLPERRGWPRLFAGTGLTPPHIARRLNARIPIPDGPFPPLLYSPCGQYAIIPVIGQAHGGLNNRRRLARTRQGRVPTPRETAGADAGAIAGARLPRETELYCPASDMPCGEYGTLPDIGQAGGGWYTRGRLVYHQ